MCSKQFYLLSLNNSPLELDCEPSRCQSERNSINNSNIVSRIKLSLPCCVREFDPNFDGSFRFNILCTSWLSQGESFLIPSKRASMKKVHEVPIRTKREHQKPNQRKDLRKHVNRLLMKGCCRDETSFKGSSDKAICCNKNLFSLSSFDSSRSGMLVSPFNSICIPRLLSSSCLIAFRTSFLATTN